MSQRFDAYGRRIPTMYLLFAWFAANPIGCCTFHHSSRNACVHSGITAISNGHCEEDAGSLQVRFRLTCVAGDGCFVQIPVDMYVTVNVVDESGVSVASCSTGIGASIPRVFQLVLAADSKDLLTVDSFVESRCNLPSLTEYYQSKYMFRILCRAYGVVHLIGTKRRYMMDVSSDHEFRGSEIGVESHSVTCARRARMFHAAMGKPW